MAGESSNYKEMIVMDDAIEFEFEGFSLEVCRSMVAMMDADLSGKLGLEEFRRIWLDIMLWKNVFKKYDFDQSGSLNTIELRAALHSAGYRINLGLLRVLAMRYGRSGKISFDDFITCIAKLKMMIETFHSKDRDKNGVISLSMDEWLKITMYS